MCQLKDRRHAYHLLVVQMQSVESKMERDLVPVLKIIKEIHMKAVDQNVSLVLIVHLTKLVLEINVETHVLVLAAKMLIVKSLIT